MAILSLLLWWGSLPLLALLLGVMILNGTLRRFPWFSVYVGYAVLAGTARFILREKGELYAYVYWFSDVGYIILGTIVTYEVFRRIVGKLIQRWWINAIFPVTVIFTLILTVLRARAILTDLQPIMAWIIGGEMCARIIEVAMFLLMLVLGALFGLRWRQHEFGICAGFGIYSVFALLASTKYYEIGSRFNFWWSVISVVSYTIAVLIWLWYFSTPIKAEVKGSEQPPLSLQDLERYKHIARRVPRP